MTPEMTDVMVLCGGRGTRLGRLTDVTPKPLLPVGRWPFLFHLLRQLQQEGFRQFILSAHYLADQFEIFARTYERTFPGIVVVIEPAPLGTGGALRHVAERVRSTVFVVLNGDSWVSQPVTPVLKQHAAAWRALTMVVVDASQVEGGAVKKGLCRLGPTGELLGFTTPEAAHAGWVNAGMYVLDREMVRSWPAGSYSFEQELPKLVSGRSAGVFCSTGRLLDIGTPECYAWANKQSFEIPV